MLRRSIELADGITLFPSLNTSITYPANNSLWDDHVGRSIVWTDSMGHSFRWYWEDAKFLLLDHSGLIRDLPYKRRGSLLMSNGYACFIGGRRLYVGQH